MEDKDKYRVFSLLEAGQTPRDVADDTGVSYASVLRLSNQFKEAKQNGTLNRLLDTDKVLIEHLGEEVGLVETASELTKGLDGLERLSSDLQKTAININSRINSLVLSVEHPSELQIYADILCNLQKSFINTNAVQVNVQNNIGGDNAPKYTKFLSDKPGGS